MVAQLVFDAAHVGMVVIVTVAVMAGLVLIALRSTQTTRAELHRFDHLMAELSDAVLVRDEHGLTKWGSPSVERVFGYRIEDMLGVPLVEVLHPEDMAFAMDQMARRNAIPGRHDSIELRVRHAAGHWISVEAKTTNLLDDPLVRGVVINLRDISDRVRSREAEARFRVAFDHAPGGMALLDGGGRIVEANGPLEAMVPSATGRRVIGLEALLLFGAPISTPPAEAMAWTQQLSGRRRSDDRTVRHRITPIGEASDAGYLLESEDVTDQLRDQGEMAWRASHDVLTGLSNREGLADHLDRFVPAVPGGDGLALLLIDLDGFKAVNDRLGHQAGDVVLTAVASRLLATARTTDLVVRLGGDEFVVVADAITEGAATNLAARIQDAIEQPIDVGGERVTVGASIGLCMARFDETAEGLIARSDKAMYEAKAARRVAAAQGIEHRGAPLPANEAQRLAALRALHLLDSERDPVVDAFTRIAAEICGTPMAAVTLLDEDRQWFKSSVGLGDSETTREAAFCGHTILGDEIFTVPDAALDDRFRANPLVVGEPLIRFYAGAPLAIEPGLSLGALCVIDREPRQLTEGQTRALADLAAILTDHLLHRAVVTTA